MRISYFVVEFQREAWIREFKLEITTTEQFMIALMITLQLTMVAQI